MNPDQGLSRSNSSFRRSSASKIDQLYEISYISDESKVPITSLPLVNPYSVFKKPQNSLSKKVKQLVGSVSNPVVKEFVQTSKFDSHQLPATTSEHLVPLTLPSDLPRICVSQGYTHIHFGAIRLALTFHGRKGLPAFSRIALVDTRFVEYQHACIGTIQTTLNAGTVFVTFYPNFNMPLNDPSLLTALKAQIQIGGTPQVNTFQATFHYQMAYRVQNHSLDIMVPGSQDNSGDALLIDIDSNATPTCTYVPKQLSREELTKLLPEKWITNYEQIHQAPVQTTTTPDFVRHQDGQVEVRFARQDRREIFSTISMLQPAEEPHFPFDVCDCQECLDEAYELEYKEETKRKKKKGSQNALKKRYEAGDPNVGLLGEPSTKFDYYVLYGDSKPKPKQTQPSRPRHPPTQVDECCMLGTTPPFPSSPGYQVEFPPLTSFEDTQQKTKHSWKIKNPTTVGATGVPESITAAEATLNWQSENAVAQNKALNAILAHQNNITKAHENLTSRVQELEGIIYEVRAKILELHHELLQLVQNSSGPQLPQGLQQKEAEMKFLKAQLADLERQHKQQRVSTYADDPWRLPTTPFVRTSFDPQPLPASSFLHNSPSLNLWAKEQAKIKARKASSTRSTSSESTSKAASSGKGKEPSGSKHDMSDNVMMMTSTKAPEKLPNRENGISSFLQALTKTSKESVPMVAPVIAPLTRDDASSVYEESSTSQSYEEVPPTDEFEHLFMNEDTTERVYVSDIDDEASQTSPQTTERAPPNTDSKQQFTFDDVLPAKWRDRSIEMLTWCTAELQYYSIDMVIKRFLARCQGRLRDWYVSLGEYRQTNILNSKTPEEFINNIFYEFIGNPVDHTIRAREEFLKMKCCSFRPKDLEKHYNRMSERFYCLQGIDDVNLKQVFLNSFPESLANEAYRALEAKSMMVAQASLGGLYQLIKNALTKLCNQKQFLVEFEKTGRRLGSACNDKHLKIKCKDDSSCSCSFGMEVFVQTSKFDSHQLPATTSEHLVPLSLPSDLPRICVFQGYTHIHFGAIRLALTFHGRKGLPAFSRIALVDTRFVEYQHACIGTIQTTLNAGTVFVTFYPNFNMPLNDPSLLTALKAQIQIGGTPQVNTFQATFHYQMAYRVQNHSLDIMVPGSQDNSGDALLIDIDSNATPTCTYVPKQLSREELTKLLPEKWITNYEQIHQAPVQTTTAPNFVRHQDGQVEVRFAKQDRREIFSTISMLQPAKEPHFPFDVCDCQECLDEAYELEYKEETKRKKKKGSQNALKKRYEAGDPNVGLLGEPSGKFDYYVLYGDSKPKPKQTQPSRPRHPPTQVNECCMLGTTPPFPSSPGYQVEFPPLTSFEDTQQKTKHSWKIKNPITVGATGVPESITAAEATLNWQSKNVVAQHKTLNAILAQQNNITKAHENLTTRVQELEGIIYEVRAKILELHHELLQLVHNSSGPQFPQGLQQKEAEMKFLKAQLADLERQHMQQKASIYAEDTWKLSTPSVQTSFDPQRLPTSPFVQTSPSLSLWSKEQAEITARKIMKSTTSDGVKKTPCPKKEAKQNLDDSPIMASSKAPEENG
ncbi:putative viral movement protein [Helianthus annuus]|nr:putative viral movement protein [Helianthus annuus]